MNNIMLYIESQVLCAILTLVLLRFNSHSIQDSLKYTVGIGYTAVVASVADVLRIAFSSNMVLAHIFGIVYFISFGVMGYLWLSYCLCRFDVHGKSLKWFSAIPGVAVAVLVVMSAKTGWIYRIDSTGAFLRGELYYAVMIDYIYVLAPFAVAVFAGKNSKRQRAGREFLCTAFFAVPAIVSAVLIIAFPHGLGTVTYAVLLTLIMVYSDYQRKIMVTDNLTELPNRYGMDAEIEEQLEQYRRDKNDSFYIIACDMDNFKTINDTWGHNEGDRALKLIADALDRVAQQYDSEVFRIGGDEFVIITDTSESGLAEQVCASLKTELDNLHFRDDFDICMSMGVSLYDGSCTITELINNADKKMYQAKQQNK